MATYKIALLSLCLLFSTSVNCKESNSEIQTIVERLNNESPEEANCEKREFRLSDCTFKCLLICDGNEFEFSFDIGNLNRIYKDKADFEDEFETLFFECNEGENCIESNSEMISPTPVFSIKLPTDKNSTLGEDAVRVFNELIENCR